MLGGLGLVVVATVLWVLAAVVFNLISDLVGGIRLTVVEEESLRPAASRRREPGPAPGPWSWNLIGFAPC